MKKLLCLLLLTGSLGASESLKNLKELQISLNDVLEEMEAEKKEVEESEAESTPVKSHQVFRLEEVEKRS
jgi:hypothetical protein